MINRNRYFYVYVFIFWMLAAQQAMGQSNMAINSKVFNPDISLNALGKYAYDTKGSNGPTDEDRNGLALQEVELQVMADVDSYFRAVALIGIEQEEGTSEYGIGPEEVYAETISIPKFTVRVGKFRTAFGRHNMLHRHAFPFIDAPFINQDLLGEEGLNEFGLSGAWLLPTNWYSEVVVQGVTSRNETLFNSPNSKDVAAIVFFKNLWDLSDATTLEWNWYGTRGDNQYADVTYAYGSDFIVRWRPMSGGGSGGKYKSLIWQSQFIDGKMYGNPNGQRLGGITSWIDYQFAQRWSVQVREDYEGLTSSASYGTKHKQSALLAFHPSEFSGIRMQYDTTSEPSLPRHHTVTLQFTFSIGAHPAHAY